MSLGAPSVPYLLPGASAPAAHGLDWLVRLRWLALGGVVAAAGIAHALGIEGLRPAFLLAVVAAASFWNLVYGRVARPITQVLVDFAALTLVLWGSGAAENPFMSLYFVHVLLAAVLLGRRAVLLACAGALLCGAFLLLASSVDALSLSRFAAPTGAVAAVSSAAFLVTMLACAHVGGRAAADLARRVREVEHARRAQKRDAEILLSALDRLDVGVEVLSPAGEPLFRNRHLLERRGLSQDCPRDSHLCEVPYGRCPVEEARAGHSGVCRFSQRDGAGRERVIELLSYPLSDERPASVLRLHLDRTETVLQERRLLFAERLASLGRAVQAIAHELNTPLATIQTLATDMRAALAARPIEAEALVRDVDESAAVIVDETRRCRAITQALLAGRDLLAHGEGEQPACDAWLALERAMTLVLGTGGAKRRVVVDDAVRGLRVGIPQDSLVQIFVNLLQNALDAMADRPDGRIRVQRGRGSPEGRITLLVDDEGPGLQPGARDRLFEAFYTTKPPGKGTGLGLYTALSLAREAGGALTLEDAPSGGARARLELAPGAAA